MSHNSHYRCFRDINTIYVEGNQTEEIREKKSQSQRKRMISKLKIFTNEH